MFVYVIRSKGSGKIYVGQTDDITERIKRHNGELPNKKTSYTSKNKGPWELVYSEDLGSRSAALLRERYLKSGSGRNFLKSKI